MALNIKNEETHRLAAELAERRGISITQAVTDAVRESLEAERRRARPGALAEELLAIGRRCARHMQGLSSGDHAAMLYDERGLPK